MSRDSIRKAVSTGTYYNHSIRKYVDPRAFLVPQARSYLKAYRVTPNSVDKLHTHADPRYRAFLLDLVRRLEDVLPSANANGWTGDNGVDRGWDGLLSVPGEFMQPRGYTETSNAALRESMGLRNSFDSEWHADLYAAMLDTLYEAAIEQTHVRSREGANSAAPFRATANSVKVPYLNYVLDNQNDIFRLIKERKLSELARKYACVFMAIAGGRGQNEPASKVRKVVAPDVAAYGESVVPFPEQAIKTSQYGGFHASRYREVIAIGAWANTLLALYMNPFTQYSLSAYAHMYKFATDAQMCAKFDACYKHLNDPVTQFMDVVTYDKTVPRFIIEAKRDWLLRTYGSSELADLYIMAMNMPILSKSSPFEVENGITPGFCLLGDPLDAEAMLNTGSRLPSGIIDTSPIGREGITFDWLIRDDAVSPLRDHRDWKLELKRRMMWGNLGYDDPGQSFLLCGGDDHAKIADRSFAAALAELGPTFGIFAAEPEDSSRLLGRIVRPKHGSPANEDGTPARGAAFELRPSPNSAMEKLFTPERDYRHPTSVNRIAGNIARLGFYDASESARECLAIADRAHESAYGFAYRSWLLSQPAGIVTKDELFLADPDVIYSFFDEEDIDVRIYESVYEGIPVAGRQMLTHSKPVYKLSDRHALISDSYVAAKQHFKEL